MSTAYTHLLNPTNTGSGIADFILVAPVSDFTDVKCPEAPFTNPGDEVTVRQAHTFVGGKGFIRLNLAPDKNQIQAPTVGDKGFSKFDETLTVLAPGSYAVQHETIKNLMNKGLIVLAKDSNCDSNLWYQLGCDCIAAFMSADFSTGTTADGIKGYELKFNLKTEYIRLYAPVDGEGDPIDPLSQLLD